MFRLDFLGLRRSGKPSLFPVSGCGTGKFRTFGHVGYGLRESPGANLVRNKGIASEAPPAPAPDVARLTPDPIGY